MYRKHISWVRLFILALPVFLFSCRTGTTAIQDDPVGGTDDVRTLTSLRRIDDYPVYTMTFYGDYGFAEHARRVTPKQNGESEQIDSVSVKWGCTCFSALGVTDSRLLGRNFDWNDCIPLLLFTDPPDGFASVSMVDLEYMGFNRSNLPDEANDRSALLRSPWMPFDGMNERGVAIGMMAIPHADPPYDPQKNTLDEIEVIRLILDYATDVSHAIELMSAYNIQMLDPPIHYLIADALGRSAIIEFVNGEMNVMTNSRPYQVSTNFIITGSGAPSVATCWRYNTVYSALRESNGCANSTQGLALLEDASVSGTIWSMIYNMSSLEIVMVAGRRFNEGHEFNLSEGYPEE